LHARHALGTATTLSPAHLRLSPVHGLALLGTPALGVLHASDGPAAELARALFHRNAGQTDGAPAAPLLPTRNRSLPAAHLTPALQGTCLGLALRQAAPATVRASLVAAGVAPLARQTKVSLARFERLVSLLGAASSAPYIPLGEQCPLHPLRRAVPLTSP